MASDMKLEVVTLPVSDVDRAKAFYERLGWRLDADIVAGDAFRVVQLTPPHSACSIAFGPGLTTGEPGSVKREGFHNPVQAAAEWYSWISPPRISRRLTAPASAASARSLASGGLSSSARCGRSRL
jgi:catechol 2,3-dioxygenase-like lactoylglutathione lyase family enzyme